MCLNASYDERAKAVLWCRNCWQCRQARVLDYTGRALAEAACSVASFTFTLTYGGGMTNQAAFLQYRDFQRMMKKLRKAGYLVRFVCAGEYGSAKNRAHWHAVLFFRDGPERRSATVVPPLPPLKTEKVHFDFWEHGTAYVDECDFKSLKYIMKYCLKDAFGGERTFRYSTVPVLGAQYFKDHARKYALAGLAPTSWEYDLRSVSDYDGKGKFCMSRKTREIYVAAWEKHWKELHGDRDYPESEVLEEHLDKRSRAEIDKAESDRQVEATRLWLEKVKANPEVEYLDGMADIFQKQPKVSEQEAKVERWSREVSWKAGYDPATKGGGDQNDAASGGGSNDETARSGSESPKAFASGFVRRTERETRKRGTAASAEAFKAFVAQFGQERPYQGVKPAEPAKRDDCIYVTFNGAGYSPREIEENIERGRAEYEARKREAELQKEAELCVSADGVRWFP